MKQFYIIRHTTPDITPGICYGISDLDVNGNFSDESSKIKHILKDVNPDLIYSSPLQRCSKLAQVLFAHLSVKYDKNLMEMNFGEWEMKKWSSINKTDLDNWSSDFMNISPPKGESFSQLYNRTLISFENIQTLAKDNSNTVLVTHSGVIRCLLMKYLEIPHNKLFSLQLNYGAVIQITYFSTDYHQVKILKG